MSDTPQETTGTASHDPDRPAALLEFMSTGWAERTEEPPPPAAAAPYRARRREALVARFPDERLVIPTGGYKTRSNDTEFRFRPGTEFAHLVGSHEPDAVLVVEPDGSQVLYQAPSMDRSTPAFFTDRMYGELWVGPRPTLTATAALLGMETRPLEELDKLSGPARVVRGYDSRVEALFEVDEEKDKQLTEFLSELRLVKDEHEIGQLQLACDATARGFEDVVRQLPQAIDTSERWIEGVFSLRARVEGNDTGYGSICAAGSHACILHWTENDGPVREGDLVLLDMGVEGHELYTADITRTLPVNGTFTPRQREVYTLVYEAQEAGIAACLPGADFLAPHRAAMEVIARGLQRMGILEDADAALAEDAQTYRRYTLHGVSHMLGIDVHDCAHARQDMYRKGPLQPAYVLTVEPGLYFQPDDLTVPEDLRGIGVRIEDDIVVTEDGPRNLSGALPRTADEVEAWMAALRD
ncbi:MAG: aminopeptidase P family protein [Actinobacteria bacterium]|nr:aminopeptidase P family protein [Actinomycetota bacterium]MCA1721481.1 aminopeptidase P family protein [Actinomycetota bacterium]